MTEARAQGTVVGTYRYNGLGQRVSKDKGAITLFVYDEAGRLIGEYDAQGFPLRETVWLDGVPLAVVADDVVYFVHTDRLGTPRAITRGTGSVIWRWDPEPFGDTTPDQDPDGDGVNAVYPGRFPGQYFDVETTLHYNYFRDYVPEFGRYLQSDPIGLAGGLNTYGYARQGPLGLSDPLGLVPFDELFRCLAGSEGVSAKGCFQDLGKEALDEHRDAAELAVEELKDEAVRCGTCVAKCSFKTLIGASPEEFLLTFGEEVAERYTLSMVELAAGKAGRIAVKTAIKRVTAPLDAGRILVCTLDCG